MNTIYSVEAITSRKSCNNTEFCNIAIMPVRIKEKNRVCASVLFLVGAIAFASSCIQ